MTQPPSGFSNDGHFALNMVPIKDPPAPTVPGRVAVCRYEHVGAPRENLFAQSPSPSNIRLPHFMSRAADSVWAVAFCGTCGVGKQSHEQGKAEACGSFIERGAAETDIFWCGCSGVMEA